MKKKKIFIIDTNVVLYDPRSILRFGNNDVVIPIAMIEEIDRFKREMNENGRNARTFSRLMDELRKRGTLLEGITLNNGGILRVDLGRRGELTTGLDISKPDNQMLVLAKGLVEDGNHSQVVFISKDINLRIKADAFGIAAEDYRPDKNAAVADDDEIYSGWKTVEVNGSLIDELFTNKRVVLEQKFLPNQFVLLRDEASTSHTAIGRYDPHHKCVVPVFKPVDGLWGIYPRNAEQTYAIDLLMNDDIKLVSLVGKAGTGKTLLALAAGLAKTVDDGVYNRLLVSRPVMPMGKDLGYLPGTVEEKLHPYMQPIFDNIDFLFGASSVAKSHRRGGIGRGTQELMEQGLLNIEPLTYIRGRSIPQQFMIVDEAQNLSPHEMKTIITRAGDNTKIVITGDTMQIDTPYLDSESNGLAYVVDCFRHEAIAGHVLLEKGERSRLSELATNLM